MGAASLTDETNKTLGSLKITKTWDSQQAIKTICIQSHRNASTIMTYARPVLNFHTASGVNDIEKVWRWAACAIANKYTQTS